MIEIEEQYLNDEDHYEETEFLVTDGDKYSPEKAVPSQQSVSACIPVKIAPVASGTTGWSRVLPHGLKVPLKRAASRFSVKREPDLDIEESVHMELELDALADDDSRAEEENYSVEEDDDYPLAREHSGAGQSEDMVTLDTLNAKLTALDDKLNQIMMKLGHHDTAFKVVKYNIKDLRTEIDNRSKGRINASSIPHESKAISPPRKRMRKRLVFLPVADDNYLLQLETQVQSDLEIREELKERFLEAPKASTYEFIRKNLISLFDNTSKYTWTGKEPNSTAMVGRASDLELVEIIIDTACEKFPYTTRDDMEEVVQRALRNFNYTKHVRGPRRARERELRAAQSQSQGGEHSYSKEVDVDDASDDSS